MIRTTARSAFRFFAERAETHHTVKGGGRQQAVAKGDGQLCIVWEVQRSTSGVPRRKRKM